MSLNYRRGQTPAGRSYQPNWSTDNMTSMHERKELAKKGLPVPGLTPEPPPNPKDPFKMGSSQQVPVINPPGTPSYTPAQITQLSMLRSQAHMVPAWIVDEAYKMITTGKVSRFSGDLDQKQKRVLLSCGVMC